MSDFCHIVCCDEASRSIEIHRVDDHGTRTLLTRVALPETEGWSPELKALAALLGENLLIDSPAARRVLRI